MDTACLVEASLDLSNETEVLFPHQAFQVFYHCEHSHHADCHEQKINNSLRLRCVCFSDACNDANRLFRSTKVDELLKKYRLRYWVRYSYETMMNNNNYNKINDDLNR